MKNKQVLQKLKSGLSINAPDVWENIADAPMNVSGENKTVVKKHPVYRRLAAVLTACLLLILAAAGIPRIVKDPKTKAPAVEFMSLLTVKAYSSTSDREGTVLKPNTRILMESYSPLMSSVPGYPFEFSYPDAEVTVSTDHGTLLLWGEETDSKVITLGKIYTLEKRETLYWSPLSDDESNQSILTVKVTKDGKALGQSKLLLVQDNKSLFYSAELISD